MPTSKFDLVAATIAAQIASGELKPLQRLPSGSALAAQFEISSNTVRAAMLVLKAKGLVYGLHGDGVFVAPTGGPRRTQAGSSDGPKHKFRIVADTITGQIASGVLKPGDLLPTYQQMQEFHRCSFGAVRDAVLILRTQGVLEALDGNGARVKRQER